MRVEIKMKVSKVEELAERPRDEKMGEEKQHCNGVQESDTHLVGILKHMEGRKWEEKLHKKFSPKAMSFQIKGLLGSKYKKCVPWWNFRLSNRNTRR